MKLVTGIFISAMLFAGCDNEDKINNEDELSSEEKAKMTFKGSDFMSLSTGKSMTFVAEGTSKVYDSLGILKNSSTIANEEMKLSVGVGQTVKSVFAYPLHYIKAKSSDIAAYMSVSNSSLLGLDLSSNSEPYILLPADFKIGKEWTVNPQNSSNDQVKLKLLDYLSSYSNKAGNKYSNVLKIELTHTGKSEYSYYYSWSPGYFYADTTKETRKISGYMYYAKNEGLVEVAITNLDVESRNVYIYRNGTVTMKDIDFNHEIDNGSISLK